jgi:glycosyltransferase involved in cell wall biosynthesis
VVRALPTPAAAAVASAAIRLPGIPYLTPPLVAPLKVARKLAENRLLAAAGPRYIVPSAAMQLALVRNGVADTQIAVIPHGVPEKERLPLAAAGARPLRFLSVGRINRVKGVHVLAAAVAQLAAAGHAFEITVAGRAVGKAEERYLDSILRTQLPQAPIAFRGHLAHDVVYDALADCDVLVLPTICVEAFGLTVAEALSVGRPVIATRCGGPEDMVTDGVNGLLVPPNDAAALAAAMTRLIEHPDELAQMAAAAAAPMTLTAHAAAVAAEYEQAIAAGQSA